jgi:soluble lytic murein transglycosylase
VVEATRLRARALDDPRAAAQLLEALPPAPGPLGEALAQHRRARDEAGVRRTLDRLLVEFPTSPEALTETPTTATASWVQALGPRALVRAESLLDAHANERARDEARLLLAAKDPPPTADTACRARFVEGKALRKLRQYKGALEALGHAVRACARDEKRQRSAQLLEIQVRAIRGEPKSLRARTEALLAADASHRFGDDALLLLAQVEEREGDVAAAKQTYQRVLDSFPTGDQAGAAAWGLAFEAIRREAWTEAEPHLRAAIAATWPEAVDRARARYWLARAHQATKRESCALYHEAAMADGLGFFTWLTLSRLDQDDAPCAQRLRDALLALDTTPTPELAARVTAERPSVVGTLAHTRALALARAVPESARDPGAQRLRTWARDALRTLVVPREDRVALALAFDELGAHKDAQDLLRAPDTGVLDRPPSATTRRAWAAAYSRAFAEEVRAAAEPERLDPLLLALVREESTFDPEIVSWAGAVGLAQLMPGTAIQAHAALRLGKLDLERLTEPELNLRLGARVLGEGLSDFGKLEPLALAAYNGGPGVAKKLIGSRAKDFDRWVEDIRIKETRNYVKRVMGTWGIYRWLYDRERPFIDVPDQIGGP